MVMVIDLLSMIRLLPALLAIASSSLPASVIFDFYIDIRYIRVIPTFDIFDIRLPPPEKVRQSFPHPVARTLALGEGLALSEACWTS